MTVPVALLLLGTLAAVVAPRLLARADWPEREPVVALGCGSAWWPVSSCAARCR